jgi:hypothetical protein
MIPDMTNDKNHSSQKQLPDFEKAEADLLKASLSRSYKERFLMATRLYKIQQTMKKAVITHKPYISK